MGLIDVIKDPFGAKRAERKAREAARAQRKNYEKQAQMLTEGLARLRETYGIGDSAAARENRARLDQLLRQREAAMVADENAQVDAGYEDAVRQDRQAAVYGGGVHSQERRAGRNLAGLIGGRQQARAVGRNATNQGMQALEQDLATQESAFLGRAVAPDSYFDAQQQHMNLQAASGNVGLQTVGNALNQGAQLVMTDANAKANDRRGIF